MAILKISSHLKNPGVSEHDGLLQSCKQSLSFRLLVIL